MQAIILAGGLGTRLKSVVSDKPKVLSPVADKPFLHFIIEYLQKQGVTSFIFSLGYLSEQVLDFLRVNYPEINYSYTIETTPLGTGGGIKKAIEHATEDDVFIINADTYFDVDLREMMRFHKESKADCTISLKLMKDFDRYGSVEMDAQNDILYFKEKSHVKEGLINGGYLLFNKTFFVNETKDKPEIFSYEKDLLEKKIRKGGIKGFISSGFFIDIGIPEDYELAQYIFSNMQN